MTKMNCFQHGHFFNLEHFLTFYLKKEVTNRQFCSIVNFKIGGNRLLLKSFRQSRIFLGDVGVGRIASLPNGFGAMLTSFFQLALPAKGWGSQ